MKSYRIGGMLAALSLSISSLIFPQQSQTFDTAAFKQFIASHQNLSTEQLQSLYGAGTFSAGAHTVCGSAQYFDSINQRYGLTAAEQSLLNKNGFMVTERLKPYSFADGYLQIYRYDLPVFVSTDAILHALHMSCDALLMQVETDVLYEKLDTLLSALHSQLPSMAARYPSASMKNMLDDIDIYLTVPQQLLGRSATPTFSENTNAVSQLLSLIKGEQPADVDLFSDTKRTIDFSQFTPRGHYTQTQQLTEYFQAMMWLGRIEMYIISPISAGLQQTDADIQRQAVDAVLLSEMMDGADKYPLLGQIDGIIQAFVGASDNITLPNIRSLIQSNNITSADLLLDSLTWKSFQDTVAQKPYAFQRINSQILMSDPMSSAQAKPASSFLLLGQRFVIDSYVTGNVVYDKIIYDNMKILRMLPSTLDVLFALGNNAAAQLLKPDLDQYKYSSNLSDLRYLIDSYDSGFWQSTIYNGWLNSIRALNPPADRSPLPPFMQTAAWWQEKMNTQLASWAQLRHDFLLYAKQSYTAGVPICSFPQSYVEPIPQFFEAVKSFAENAAAEFQQPVLQYGSRGSQYFAYVAAIADTLGSIARKELSNTPLSESETVFLRSMLYIQTLEGGCVPETVVNGWYAGLYYDGQTSLQKHDMTIADVHTAPTDSLGNPVGWVLHAGTGPLNLAVVIAALPGKSPTAFIGPVLSYYEYLATNFTRLTDEEWATMYNVSPSLRPSFTNLYLADSMGSAKPEGASLVMGVNNQPPASQLPTTLVLEKNFPNPFNSSTIIMFTIPSGLANANTELAVYDIQGRLVKRLLSQRMPAGKYAARWDGSLNNGTTVASGVYFYHLVVGDQHRVGKMSFIK
ncbi:MAG TPA: DUF3160 domain-containing protein [Bacteroidota bacterium]|nr:DUF3160 domain-containing protein [Bacteroidota bacterium]